jgi:hypothetical protein
VKKRCEIDHWPKDDGKNGTRFRGDPGEKCRKRLLNRHGLQGKGLLIFIILVRAPLHRAKAVTANRAAARRTPPAG